MTKHSASRRWPATLGITALATVLGTVLALFVGAEVASAANVSGVSFSGSSQAAGATNTTWTIGLSTAGSPPSALGPGSSVTVTFASGFTVATMPPVTLGTGFSNCSSTATTTSSRVVTVTLASSGGTCSLPNGTAAQLTIGSVTNPTAGTYAASSFSAGTSKDNAASPLSAVVIFGTASKLAFTTQPAGTVSGTAFTTQPVVTVQDSGGRTVANDTSSVTLTITSGTGTAGASLTCTTNPKAAASGVASFAGCRIDKAGTGYTLTATDGTLTAAVSNSFTVGTGAAAKLAFTQNPAESAAGSAITPTVTVQLQDQFGNPVSAGGITVTLSSSAGPLDGGASATTSATGLASFGSAQINTAATGLTLTATSTGLTAATSGTFDVVVQVSNGIPLTDAAADAGSGVKTVSYYYCPGLIGTCANGTLIGSASTPGNSYLFTWTGQPANGAYRLVAVASDNVSNASSPSASIPIRIFN